MGLPAPRRVRGMSWRVGDGTGGDVGPGRLAVAERPAIFDVMAARRFDRERVGQRLYGSRVHGWFGEQQLLRRYGGNRDWFNTRREGSSNAGHDLWSRIKTDENRRALIEYLKTL